MEDTIQAMRDTLDAAEAAREAVLLRHMARGVQIDSRTVCIDETVQIAPAISRAMAVLSIFVLCSRAMNT